MIEFVARLQLTTKRCFPEPSLWLTSEEVRVFERLKTPQRRQDWLAGRWAAKELIQKYLYNEAGRELALSHIEIMNDENGAPYARVPRTTRPLRDLRSPSLKLGTWNFEISLAHSAGYGLAGFSPHGPIGVDLQQIRPVRSDLIERVLTEYEREKLTYYFPQRPLEGFFVFWTLKEATIKALRIRPALPWHSISIRLTKVAQAEILLPHGMLLGQWHRWQDFIWAVVWG